MGGINGKKENRIQLGTNNKRLLQSFKIKKKTIIIYILEFLTQKKLILK